MAGSTGVRVEPTTEKEIEALAPAGDPFGVAAGSGLPKPEEVGGLAEKAESLVVSFRALADNFDAQVKAAREKFRTNHDGVVPKGDAARGMTGTALASIQQAAEQAVEAETSQYRRDLIRMTDKDRTEQLRQLSATASRLAAAVRVFPSPQAYLSAQALGDDRRSQYHAQVAHAGAAELGTLARVAVATSNRALGAAVLARLDTLPRDARPFGAAEFAGRMVGEEHGALAHAARRADAALQQAINRNRVLTSGRPNPAGRIADGLRAEALKPPVGPPPGMGKARA